MDHFLKAADGIPFLVVAVPLAALAVNVLVQIGLLRCSQGACYLRSLMGGFLAGFGSMALAEWLMVPHPEELPDLVGGIAVRGLTYTALAYCYVHFVNLGQTSIRIRIYSEIAEAPDGLSLQDIERDYNETTLMNSRLQRMVKSGDIIERDGLYFIGSRRLLPVVKILFAAKHLLLSKGSEFH